MNYKLIKRHNGTVSAYETLDTLDGVPARITKSGRPITGTYYGVQHPRISARAWERKNFTTLTDAKKYITNLFLEAN